MTSTAVAPDPNAVAAVGTPRLFAGVGEGAPESSEHHHRTHGALTMFDHDWLVRATADVGLRGRGGAAFPVTRKLAGTPRGRSTEVVVNLSEGEPASRKDRVLARLAPHLIIDGALTVAHALKTRRITIAVKDTAASASLRRAISTASAMPASTPTSHPARATRSVNHPALVMATSGAWIVNGRPSTPAFVAMLASRSNSAMNSGRQSG